MSKVRSRIVQYLLGFGHDRHDDGNRRHIGWWRGGHRLRRRRRVLGDGRRRPAEADEQADGGQVDVALVVDGVVDPVALILGTHAEGFGEVVLQTSAVLVVGGILAGTGAHHDHRTGAREGVLRVGVDHAGATEHGELLGQGHIEDGIQIHAIDLGLAAQRPGRQGGQVVTHLAQIEVAPLQAEPTVELVAAEHLEPGVLVVILERGDAQACTQEAAGDSGVIDLGPGLAHVEPEVPP